MLLPVRFSLPFLPNQELYSQPLVYVTN